MEGRVFCWSYVYTRYALYLSYLSSLQQSIVKSQFPVACGKNIAIINSSFYTLETLGVLQDTIVKVYVGDRIFRCFDMLEIRAIFKSRIRSFLNTCAKDSLAILVGTQEMSEVMQDAFIEDKMQIISSFILSDTTTSPFNTPYPKTACIMAMPQDKARSTFPVIRADYVHDGKFTSTTIRSLIESMGSMEQGCYVFDGGMNKDAMSMILQHPNILGLFFEPNPVRFHHLLCSALMDFKVIDIDDTSKRMLNNILNDNTLTLPFCIKGNNAVCQ